MIVSAHPQNWFAHTRSVWIRSIASAFGLLTFVAIVVLRFYVGRKEKRHDESQAPSKTSSASVPSSLEDRVAQDRDWAQDLAVPCWKATLRTAGIWVVLVIASGWLLAAVHALVGFGCAVMAIFSGWRYMERRLKRTSLTYAYAIALSIRNEDPATT